LEKFSTSGDETYAAHVEGPHAICECRGFLRWDHCKQVAVSFTSLPKARGTEVPHEVDHFEGLPPLSRMGHDAERLQLRAGAVPEVQHSVHVLSQSTGLDRAAHS